jgi:hypothetical protein
MPQAARIERPSRRLVLAIATHAPLGWLAIATQAAGRAADPSPDTADAEPTVVPIRRDDPAGYQNFVVNWDAGTEVLCAVVRTPADYARLFHPAPVIGGKKPFAPPDAAFEKEHLVVIARVVGGDGGSSLAIERVVEKEGSLVVHGRFKPSTAQSSFSIKQAALAWIPAREPGQMTFIENDTTLATLDAGKDAWVVPDLPEAAASER